jgi:uncharacterized protein YdiU (UPF0061 family)
MKSILADSFKNEFVAHFPGDNSGSVQPRQTPGVLYSSVLPTPVKQPELLAWSDALASELGIERPVSAYEVGALAGNHTSQYMQPYSACYGGHQFGHWTGQLGDGRAITLGEWLAPGGTAWELQLKGGGMTPYSRRADGRAVLRSSVREYLMSEAMHYLGVPTTRALSLVSTGDQVVRDMFYDGHPAPELGAIVMRVAPTFLRFGNFELLAVRKELDNLRSLVGWTINRFYPEIEEGEDRIVRWYREVVRRTAELMAQWMRVGFVHGVMNTDNMSIAGLTIDYGPYSFLDNYDPLFTPNTTDLPGRRYAFARQPGIGKWNLACLAGALSTLVPETQPLADALQAYDDDYTREYYTMMGRKLGLDKVNSEDIDLINRIEGTLTSIQPDMTIFFRRLIEFRPELTAEEDIVGFFKDTFYNEPDQEKRSAFVATISAYAGRINKNSISSSQRDELMRTNNPSFILRNYLLHQAIEELERGERTLFDQLEAAIKDPYSEHPEVLIGKRPDWATQQAGCSMLSCSS